MCLHPSVGAPKAGGVLAPRVTPSSGAVTFGGWGGHAWSDRTGCPRGRPSHASWVPRNCLSVQTGPSLLPWKGRRRSPRGGSQGSSGRADSHRRVNPARAAASYAAQAGARASGGAQKSRLWGEAGRRPSLFPCSGFLRTGAHNEKQINSGKKVSCARGLANARCCKGESDLVFITTTRTGAEFQIFFLTHKCLLCHDVPHPEEEQTPGGEQRGLREPSRICRPSFLPAHEGAGAKRGRVAGQRNLGHRIAAAKGPSVRGTCPPPPPQGRTLPVACARSPPACLSRALARTGSSHCCPGGRPGSIHPGSSLVRPHFGLWDPVGSGSTPQLCPDRLQTQEPPRRQRH